MKIQQVFTSYSELKKLEKLITLNLNKISNLKDDIAKHEMDAVSIIRSILLNDLELKKFDSMLGINFSSTNDGGSIVTDNLSTIIAIQISESINRFYNTPAQKENSLINYGGRFYKPNDSSLDIVNIKDELDELNKVLKKYNVYIYCSSKNLIHLRIFN